MLGHEEFVWKMGAAFAHGRSQKRACVVASEQSLGVFPCDYKEFLRRYVTIYET